MQPLNLNERQHHDVNEKVADELINHNLENRPPETLCEADF